MADRDLPKFFAELRINANIPDPATQFRSKEPGWGSIYAFDIREGQMVYRYDVEIKDMEKDKSLTMGGGDDGKKGLLKDLCYQLIRAVHDNSQAFCVGNGNGKAQFIYDNRKNMYTNHRIGSFAIELNKEMQPQFCQDYLRGRKVRVEIQPCKTEAHELALNDIPSALCPSPDRQADRSLRTFLELLTSQPFINSGTHDIIGMGRLFEKQIYKQLDEAIVLRNGIAKGVRIITNGEKKPCPALVADVKTCAFYRDANLEEIVMGMIQRQRIDTRNSDHMARFRAELNQLFRGVSGTLTYAQSRVVVIDSLTERLMRDISFDVDGRATNMVDFFGGKGIKVNGNMPAVRQQNDRETLFPMSCIHILPNQRINLDKMNDFISRELLNANSVMPAERHYLIDQEVKKIGMLEGECGKFMFKFGVKLKGKKGNVDVDIGMRQLPKMKFSNADYEPDIRAKGQFAVRAPTRYLEVYGKLSSLKWMVAFPRRVAKEKVEEFFNKVLNSAKSKGMIFSAPQFNNIELDSMKAQVEELAKRQLQYLVYVDFKMVKSHSPLKLLEKRFNILTQHLTFDPIQKDKAGPAYISNVLNKMNMKLFGQNYMVIMDPITKKNFDLNTTLVIGIDTSKPAKASSFERFRMAKKGMKDFSSEDPMIIGICANYDKNPIKFNGDYYFQPCKQDVLIEEMLDYKLSWMLNKVKQNRGKAPQTIFIIRDGVSEGMVPNSVRDEFPVFVRACTKFDATWKPKFVFCIVDKRHNKRFFVQNGNHIENTMPGAVIDRKYVRIDIHEFFLQAHYPLKGVSKIPQYVFPVNQTSAGNDELQSFIMGLCHMWQIVYLSPALPTPVRQASELAKRGRNNFVELKRTEPHAIPRTDGIIDYAKLNAMLSYNGSILSNTRFNA